MSKTSIPWTATTNGDGSVTKGHTWNPIKARLLEAIERPDPGDPRLKILQKPWGYHCEKVSPRLQILLCRGYEPTSAS